MSPVAPMDWAFTQLPGLMTPQARLILLVVAHHADLDGHLCGPVGGWFPMTGLDPDAFDAAWDHIESRCAVIHCDLCGGLRLPTGGRLDECNRVRVSS